MNVAKAIDAIPVVASSTERGILFPVPAVNQRVYNLTTDAVELWNGAAWVTAGAGGIKAAQSGIPEGNTTAAIGMLSVQSDAVNSPTIWRKKKGIDAFGWAPVDPPLLIPALTTGTGSITAFGDSFTAGQGAAPATESYVNVIGAALGGAVTSLAVGGTGVYTTIAQFYAQIASWTPRHPVATLILWMAGFNDVRRNGAATLTLAKIKNCLRAFIAVAFSNTNVAASDAAVTKVGAWTNFTPAGGQTRATSLGGNALSGVSGMTASWNFTGDSLVIGTFVSDGVTYSHGPATITVDGVLIQTYNPDQQTDNIADSAYDNGRVPSAIVLRGLGSGAHTVVIAPTHATKPFIVDYLSTLLVPGDASPLLVGVPCRMNATGYAIAPASATDAGMATAASAIMDVVNEFPDYPIRSVWPNSQYDLATGVSGDNIHPNNVGHYQIAKAFLYAIQTALTPIFRGASANSTKIGRVAVAGGASATAVGDNAQALVANSTAVGTNALSTTGGVAVGSSAAASAATTVAVGTSAAASATDATAVGANAVANSASSTALGSGAQATGLNATAIGKAAATASGVAVGSAAAASGTTSVAVGKSSTASAADCTALGDSAVANAASAVAVGSAAQATNTNTTCVGKGANSNADRGTAVGAVATAPASSATAIGSNTSAAHATATALGKSATTTAANQVRLGTATEFVSAPGGLTLSHTANKTANYNALQSDHVIPGDATAGAFNVVLPDATLAQHLDRTYVIKKVDASANAVTVTTTGGQTIDGAATKVLGAQWAFVRVMSNGANWLIIG